jgi:sugar-specific transcriptional regulator TrmB
MTQEKVLRTLESVGLNQSDSQVYIFLGKKGPQRARDISAAIKMPKNLLYQSLKNLQARGIVNVILEKPARFSAEPFEKVLDIFVRAKLEEVKKIESNKSEILSEWKSIAVGTNPDKLAKFTVLEGRSSIYSRLKHMLDKTKREVLIISTVPGLIRAEQFGLLDLLKPKVKVKFLTELSENDIGALKTLLRQKRRFGYEGRVPELGLRLFTRIIIRDSDEAAFFLSNDEQRYNQESDVCLWTNCKSLVDSFTAVFENLWVTSTDIEQLLQSKNRECPLQTSLIVDSKEAQVKYNEAMRLAQNEIIMITSTEALDYEMKKGILEKKAIDAVSVKILVPITGKNFNMASRLSESCKIRHIPPSYIDTTLIDGKQLFQFKSTLPERNNLRSYFENTVYINDSKYIEKTQALIKNIWKKAYEPLFFNTETSNAPKPATVLEVEEKRNTAYSKVFNFVQKPIIPINITEKEILNKILNAKRKSTRNSQNKGITLYGSVAQAFIHPSDNFDVPDMMIQVFNNKVQSSFGTSIQLLIYLKTVLPQGFSYIPTVSVQTNQGLSKFLRTVHRGTTLEKNSFIFLKGELEVREQSNTLFLGWTKPIYLPNSEVLPPSGLLFEGYGEVRTNIAKLKISNGWQVLTEGNSLEAFTTFYHSSSKYSGPGTDGIFFRDHVMTYIPPLEATTTSAK